MGTDRRRRATQPRLSRARLPIVSYSCLLPASSGIPPPTPHKPVFWRTRLPWSLLVPAPAPAHAHLSPRGALELVLPHNGAAQQLVVAHLLRPHHLHVDTGSFPADLYLPSPNLMVEGGVPLLQLSLSLPIRHLADLPGSPTQSISGGSVVSSLGTSPTDAGEGSRFFTWILNPGLGGSGGPTHHQLCSVKRNREQDAVCLP